MITYKNFYISLLLLQTFVTAPFEISRSGCNHSTNQYSSQWRVAPSSTAENKPITYYQSSNNSSSRAQAGRSSDQLQSANNHPFFDSKNDSSKIPDFPEADNIYKLREWIEKGGDCRQQAPDTHTFPGATPAHIVLLTKTISQLEKSKLISMMLERFPQIVNIQNNDGDTLGHVAARLLNTDILGILANCGDDFKKINYKRKSILDYLNVFASRPLSPLEDEKLEKACRIVFPKFVQAVNEDNIWAPFPTDIDNAQKKIASCRENSYRDSVRF